jgi:fibronectin type 3 domain-containing protein
MGSPVPRFATMPLTAACMTLAACVALALLASCRWDKTSSGHASSSASPIPQQTGISATEATALVPLAPSAVTAQVAATGVRVGWLGTGEDDVHYVVRRKMVGAQEWAQLTIIAISGDNRGSYAFTDATAERGKSYGYGVVAVNSFGRESEITQSSPVNMPAS